jgi:Ser-tRNA(Ala) deacylase AlaX
MTKKIFWENPYQASHETRVTSVNGPVVTVEETIFYGFSGGQESDSGTIAGYPVIQATKAGKEIEYTLSCDHDLRDGDVVMIHIDWGRRYKLMRLHFAAELVLELIYKKLTGVNKIGAHIAEEKARIDFEWPESIAPLLTEIVDEAKAVVESDGEIISAFSNEAEEKRFWKIEDFSKVPCGGTHLKRTSEVGALRLKRKNIGKGKERVEIYLVEPG